MSGEKSGLNMLSWAEEDRPREKLLLKGKSALSDAELIAIPIGIGNQITQCRRCCQTDTCRSPQQPE